MTRGSSHLHSGVWKRRLPFFLVAQMGKNLPAVQETRVRSLGQEDPLEKGVATHSSQYSGLENPHGQRSLVGCSPCGQKESDMTEQLMLWKTKSLFSSWLQTRQTTQMWCVGCWRLKEYWSESLRVLSSFCHQLDKLNPLV